MKINEQNFVRQMKLGNEKALLYAIEEYGGLVKAVIGKHMYHFSHLQEECTNDVFLGVWKNASYFDPGKNTFKNWIAGVARLKSIDYLRKYQKERLQVEWEKVTLSMEDENLNKVLESTISEEMEYMLSCLKPLDRELFLKLYVEEQTMEEIARDMGMNKAVIYNHLSRGKKKIKNKIFEKRGVNKYES